MRVAILCVLVGMFFAAPVSAQTYNLKRVVITGAPSFAFDSMNADLEVSGTMTVTGDSINQNFRVCIFGSPCEETSAVGTILNVHENGANVVVRDGFTGLTTTMTLLSLHPTIITMVVFGDGTVEVDEWELAR